MKDVAVLGVGMYRFGMWSDVSNATMGRDAGMAALRDAAIIGVFAAVVFILGIIATQWEEGK